MFFNKKKTPEIALNPQEQEIYDRLLEEYNQKIKGSSSPAGFAFASGVVVTASVALDIFFLGGSGIAAAVMSGSGILSAYDEFGPLDGFISKPGKEALKRYAIKRAVLEQERQQQLALQKINAGPPQISALLKLAEPFNKNTLAESKQKKDFPPSRPQWGTSHVL